MGQKCKYGALLLGFFLISAPDVCAQIRNSQNAIIPKAITTRNEKKVFVTNVNFRFDSYVLDKDYLGNGKVLGRLDSFVDSLGQKSVKTIEIVSQSSPEGRYEYNRRLSSNRAEAVRNYLSGSYSELSRKLTLSPDGESWGQLREYVVRDERMTAEGRERVLAAIDSRDGMEARKRMMSNLGSDANVGDLYGYLLETYYPLIRNSAIYLVHTEAVGGPRASTAGRKTDAPVTAKEAPRSAGRPSTSDPVSKPAPSPAASSAPVVSSAPAASTKPSASSASAVPAASSTLSVSSASSAPAASSVPAAPEAAVVKRTTAPADSESVPEILPSAPQYAAVTLAGDPSSLSSVEKGTKARGGKRAARDGSRKRRNRKESVEEQPSSVLIPPALSPSPSIPSARGTSVATVPLQ